MAVWLALKVMVFASACRSALLRPSAAASADAMVSALDGLAALKLRLENVSAAGPYNKLLDLAVQGATARGMVIVAAAEGGQFEQAEWPCRRRLRVRLSPCSRVPRSLTSA